MNMKYSKEKPWIPEREVTICLWESDKIRGDYTNPFAAKITNVFSFSRRQMNQYMSMMKSFGYTGVQLIDGCYSWCQAGSIEAFHDRLIMMAEEARKTGLQISLWVWASFFSGFGWVDPEAVYVPQTGFSAYTDPKVHAIFEKYYNVYAELAPFVDRLIGHFFDPGLLTKFDDIFAYMALLADKFKAKNPMIQLAVDTWGAPAGFADALSNSDLDRYLLLEQPLPNLWPGDSRVRFRQNLKQNGFQVGTWGWHTTEYETDQLAAMYVNGHVLKNRYLKIKEEGDGVLPAVYWSEMDAYHVLNLFSLYCAAQLLIDPYRNPDDLLLEIAKMIWPLEDAEKFYDVLKTIEDIRSGPEWETYWWTCPEFRWGTGNNSSDKMRIEKSIMTLEELANKKKLQAEQIALPFQPWILAKLMLPHLEQMRLLAEFKDKMAELDHVYQLDQNKTDFIYFELCKMLKPISNFNTWVGNFLQIEQREQYRILQKFCKRIGIPIPQNALRLNELRRCSLEKAAASQKGRHEPFLFNSVFISEGYLAYPQFEAIQVLESLYKDQLIEYKGNGQFQLINWQDYIYNFDVN